jgi:WD40 repeat protein
VNTVRWSRDGTLLASGSDDCYILIYKLEGANKPTTQSVGSLAPHNQVFFVSSVSHLLQENWVRNLALHGHQMDVLDLDWSPTGLLASASIDNHILIWDIPSSLKSSSSVLVPLRQLNKHTSFVKGIQFDPFGIYLASSSSDNTVIIWNCDTWNAEHILEEPLRGSTDRSIFRRLSWAPDGGSLCITCALKEGKPVGMVLKRDIWDTSVADLVGHNAQTTCCRFNPHPLKISTSNSDANFTACTVALADQQGVLSLWTTTKKSPIFVVYNLFEGPVLDLAWFAQSDTSFLLGACSLDGSIVFLKLTGSSTTGGERCLSADEKDSHLKSIYGRGDKELSNSSTVLPEDPAVLRFKLDEQFEIANTRIAQKRKIVPISQPNFQQTITRLKNGKKRIQPIVTDSEVDLSSSLFATGANSSSLPTMTMYQPRARDHAPPPLHGNYLHPLLCTLSQRSQVPALLESVSASCIVKQNGVLTDPCSPFGLSSLKDRSTLLQFYLTASELPPPRATDPIVSAISLARFGNSIPRQGQAEWETYVTGKVTTISGVKSIGANGIVTIGTSLGTLLILCLSSGMKLASPLTLGGSIISADAVFLRDSKIFHIFALNSEGDLWLFSCHPQSLFSPTESGLKLVCKSSLHPLRSFLGLGGGEQGVATAMHLENTELTDSGELIVSVKSSNPNLSGGSFHFQLLNDLQCWRQISHLKSFLSM